MRHSSHLRLFLTVLPLLLATASLSSTALPKSTSKLQAVDWEALIPQIEQALGEGWTGCHPDMKCECRQSLPAIIHALQTSAYGMTQNRISSTVCAELQLKIVRAGTQLKRWRQLFAA